MKRTIYRNDKGVGVLIEIPVVITVFIAVFIIMISSLNSPLDQKVVSEAVDLQAVATQIESMLTQTYGESSAGATDWYVDVATVARVGLLLDSSEKPSDLTIQNLYSSISGEVNPGPEPAENHPPNKPSTPVGETSPSTRYSYSYVTSAVDPDNDAVFYRFDWGDGLVSGWIGPFSSGDLEGTMHRWVCEGQMVPKNGGSGVTTEPWILVIPGDIDEGPGEWGSNPDDWEYSWMNSDGDYINCGSLENCLANNPNGGGYNVAIDDEDFDGNGNDDNIEPCVYEVRAQAQDIYSALSEWSDPLVVEAIGELTFFSFLADTKIAMADGTLKNIQDVQAGDLVKAFDEKTITQTIDEVTKTFCRESTTDYYIVFNDDLKVTPNHRLYINGSWVQAGQLKVGDYLSSGIIICSIENIYERPLVYNFETEIYHNYNVVLGENNNDYVIAHNGDNNYYPVGGYDEQDSNEYASKESTDNDYTSIVNLYKIWGMTGVPYQKMKKEIFNLPDTVDFYVTIKSYDGVETLLDYQPDAMSIYSANIVALQQSNIVVCDPVYETFIYGVIEVAAFQ